jgi:hypothetical protein
MKSMKSMKGFWPETPFFKAVAETMTKAERLFLGEPHSTTMILCFYFDCTGRKGLVIASVAEKRW